MVCIMLRASSSVTQELGAGWAPKVVQTGCYRNTQRHDTCQSQYLPSYKWTSKGVRLKLKISYQCLVCLLFTHMELMDYCYLQDLQHCFVAHAAYLLSNCRFLNITNAIQYGPTPWNVVWSLQLATIMKLYLSKKITSSWLKRQCLWSYIPLKSHLVDVIICANIIANKMDRLLEKSVGRCTRGRITKVMW